MIVGINHLKSFGIFKDFDGASIKKFGRYNLVYGWNGTGKSTLSSLFASVEARAVVPRFAGGQFSLSLEDSSSITDKNVSQTLLNIHVFNQGFIQKNINWDKSVNSILLIAKEKIDEVKKLEELNGKLGKKNKLYLDKGVEAAKVRDSLEKFMTNAARKMKLGLQSIDTADSYYLNYDRRKLANFIKDNEAGVVDTGSILDDKAVIKLTNSARPDQMPAIAFYSNPVDPEYYGKAVIRIRDLIATTAVNQAIQRLSDNPDIREWVQTGLDLHEKHNSKACEFCASPFTPERASSLAAHFSKEFTDFQARLQSAATWIESQGAPTHSLPASADFYKEFSTDFEGLKVEYDAAVNKIDTQVAAWKAALLAKIEDPMRTNIEVTDMTGADLLKFNSVLASLTSLVALHNKKTANFKAETTKSKKALELHYAAAEIQEFDYSANELKIQQLESEAKAAGAEVAALQQEIDAIEASLSNETVGADEFNDTLHKFIGRSELCLKFNKDKKGYEIIRNGVGEHDGNLSEGEKTAIAFVYFITKLRENGNKISDTVVVVDDPVSSFDSNHLFHAYSFLRTQCQDARQLFVLTHNFTYFKLVRDWFAGKNKGKDKPDVSFFYQLDASPGSPRSSKLVDADDSLKNYGSEYHYIFKKLFEYRSHASLNRDEAFLTANLSRKLVESFFTFKFPKRRGNISQLMDDGLKGCAVTTPEVKEKIYRFINKYSHSDVIEITDESAENLAGESHSVIGDIFRWMEEVDKKHYEEMVVVVSAQ